MRVRIDHLPMDPGASASKTRPCANAIRMQGIRRGRVEQWWEVSVETFEEFVDILRRAEGNSAVIELIDGNQTAYPPVRVWLVEEEWQREVTSSGPPTPGE